MGGPVSGPGPQLSSDFNRQLDFTDKDSLQQGEELSYYALDITSISDLIQQ